MQEIERVVYLLNPTSNHNATAILKRPFCCISFESYIKPQLAPITPLPAAVVYLLNPTSNHNVSDALVHIDELYIFWILHQTTTPLMGGRCLQGCISFESYIKPQHLQHPLRTGGSCISFESYIKPQPRIGSHAVVAVVYLLNPTSNHNFGGFIGSCPPLYIFWILHQTTTDKADKQQGKRCISFESYIKPQQCSQFQTVQLVVYLLNPTSNHNCSKPYRCFHGLYIFWILHQTTTSYSSTLAESCCISFESYIKPQLFNDAIDNGISCISFESYIKPQPSTHLWPTP